MKARRAAKENAQKAQEEDELAWQVPPIHGLIEKAKTSGGYNELLLKSIH